MASPRLIYVVNEARWFVTHRLPVARAARAAGYDVQVASPPGPFAERIRQEGFRWTPIPLARGGLNPFHELRLILSLIRLYRKVRPAVVHHVTAKPVLYGTIAARLTGVRAIVNAVPGLGHVFLSDKFPYPAIRAVFGRLYPLVLRHPRLRVIFQNNDDLELFVRSRWIRPSDAVLIPSGVDPDAFRPAAERPQRVPVAMAAARLLYTKGIREFVRAAEQLKNEGVRARFVLVGDADDQNPGSISRDELDRWRQAGVVELWGERHDMPAVYAEADVVCLPSYREGMPKTLIEASSCGLPAITTDTPGCRDVIADGETGYLVPVGDSKLLAERLRYLLEHPEERERMGAAGRARVLAEFSADLYAQRTLALYEDVLR